MSKVRESKKKDQRKAALEPYTEVKHLEESLNYFTRCHKTKQDILKKSFQLVTDDTQKLKQEVVKNQAIIRDLRNDITIKNEELAKTANERDKLNTEKKELKQELVTIEVKFANLEVNYDQNVKNMMLEIASLKQDMEHQANTHKKLAQEHAEYCNKLEATVVEKTNSHDELTEKVKQLVHSFEEHKISSFKKHEEAITALKSEIEDLKSQLTLKDEELAKINNEKRELEESKNKTIDEQAFKIRAIERVFDHPLQRVQPHLNGNSISPQQVPPFSDQPSASVTTSNIINTVAHQVNASRPDIRQSVRATRNNRDNNVSRESIQRRLRERRTLPTSMNSDSDSDSEIAHHVPNIHVDIVCALNIYTLCLSVNGAGSLKLRARAL